MSIWSGGARCGLCPAGMLGDGRDCRRDLCQPNPCYPGVACQQHEDAYTCGACPVGYAGDGKRCNRLTTCADRPCFQGVPCYDSVDGFRLWAGKTDVSSSKIDFLTNQKSSFISARFPRNPPRSIHSENCDF